MNPDGTLDFMNALGFDSRLLRIMTVPTLSTPYSQATLLFTGSVDQITMGWQTVTVQVRDKFGAIEVQAITARPSLRSRTSMTSACR